ncbi:NUMOD3 MOTIF FAMILY PROTEIN EXPRESSED [Salix viminalis]|uniref:NUMOD3 MOTIF FAMILY PROTEIN EXPRESSED n=1 Tax=Salix viminalis TaxID=40686 RepID=A0A9Q0QD21_SALVM|nr:NUMOD3 MOTIF FAMILY PROTEIN EXPRESSED [Salix viminalis]
MARLWSIFRITEFVNGWFRWADIATSQASLSNHLGLLGAQTNAHCKVFSSPFAFGDDKRLLSLGKSIKFRRKINAFERSKLQIKAVATFEPKSLVRKGDGKRKTSLENEQIAANSNTLLAQVDSSGNMPWNKGRKHSPETLQKIRERTKLAMQDPKIKMKLASLGHAQSKETREKIGHGNLIAEASRRGYTGEEELQWDSYKILRQQLEVEWVESVQQRKTSPRPKGSKRAPKSLEQRRKISEAIAAKWADPEYRERVYSGLSKFHGTQAGAPRKPRRVPSGSSQSARRDSSKRRSSDTEKGNTRSPIQKLRRRSKTPSYKDPLASSKLEMIKNIRAQRTATETKKNEAIERARSLIVEAEKAANALEAIQSIESVDRGNGVSSDSISNVNDRYPSLALTELVSEDEKEINAGNESMGQVELRQVNGTMVMETSKDEDLNFSNLVSHDILNGQGGLLPLSSSAYSLPSLTIDHSSSGKQPDQVEPNGSLTSEKINSPNGSRVQYVKEETPSKSVATKKWVHGRLVEGTEGDRISQI